MLSKPSFSLDTQNIKVIFDFFFFFLYKINGFNSVVYKINCFKLLSFTSVFKLKCFMTSSEMGTSIIFHISCFCYQMLEKDERHIGVQSCSWWILMNQTHHLKTGGSLEIVSEQPYQLILKWCINAYV